MEGKQLVQSEDKVTSYWMSIDLVTLVIQQPQELDSPKTIDKYAGEPAAAGHGLVAGVGGQGGGGGC